MVGRTIITSFIIDQTRNMESGRKALWDSLILVSVRAASADSVTGKGRPRESTEIPPWEPVKSLEVESKSYLLEGHPTSLLAQVKCTF